VSLELLVGEFPGVEFEAMAVRIVPFGLYGGLSSVIILEDLLGLHPKHLLFREGGKSGMWSPFHD
jgi:hypothetical protein